jgi:flagellin-like protein
MKSFRKSIKALSPVVASIILIAVTVAVSIAVAAWMGALSFGFMGSSENLNVGNPWGWTATTVYLNVTNNGGSSITLNAVRVGSSMATFVVDYRSGAGTGTTLQAGESAGLKVTSSFTSGVPYTITIVTATNKEFPTTGTPNL